MPDLADGESTEMHGSGSKPYVLKNTGGVYSCSCPAWRNQSIAIEQRTCKHLRKLRGDDAEQTRIGSALPGKPVMSKAAADGSTGEEGDDAAGPPILLAHSWDNAMDLAGWWMSEKLDGVRAYWDGKQFLSRQGNLYHAPDWFTAGLPNVPLDGELWIDRKKFQRTVSIVRRQDKSEHWKEVKFLVFDAPAATGGFEDRVAFVNDALKKTKLAYVQSHEHQLCKNIAMLRTELARVEALGGEGLMLRQPGSKYVAGRSETLLKVKTFHDAEAEVIGHQAGAGKHKGRLGALLVKLADGTEFAVGTGFSDKERGAPPAIGATITFRYQELSDGGVPRFPSYVGVRSDAAGNAKTQAKPVTPSAAVKSAVAVVKTETSAKPAASAKADGSTKATGGEDGGVIPRYFEFDDGDSSKFWEVTLSGCDVTTRWGRIGSDGQSKTKTFASPEAALKEKNKLIDEKSAKGYEEIFEDGED